MESWLRESCLIPWVHYIPVLPDFSDLEEKMMLCETHLDKCEAIARHGTEYIRALYKGSKHLYAKGSQQLRIYLDAVSLDFTDPFLEKTTRPLNSCIVA